MVRRIVTGRGRTVPPGSSTTNRSTKASSGLARSVGTRSWWIRRMRRRQSSDSMVRTLDMHCASSRSRRTRLRSRCTHRETAPPRRGGIPPDDDGRPRHRARRTGDQSDGRWGVRPAGERGLLDPARNEARLAQPRRGSREACRCDAKQPTTGRPRDTGVVALRALVPVGAGDRSVRRDGEVEPAAAFVAAGGRHAPDGVPYSVVRGAGRPMAAAMASSWAIVFRGPFSLPAIRLMVSSISVPPRSLAPPWSTAEVPASVADLLHRQRVGVGVGAPLGGRAEPAAGVADVGEVDVPVDDVGDIVAVDVTAPRRPARRSSPGRCRRRPAAPGTPRR